VKSSLQINKIFSLSIYFLLSIASAEEPKPFKYEEKVRSILEDYLSSVDEKNIDGMLKHLTMPFDLHFDSQRITPVKSEEEFRIIFGNWKNSSRSNFDRTEIKSITINHTGVIRNMFAVADITYNRLDKDGNLMRTERALYHFVKGTGYYGKPLKFIWAVSPKWARKWNIYMISNVELNEE
jgi:hypothetical protein